MKRLELVVKNKPMLVKPILRIIAAFLIGGIALSVRLNASERLPIGDDEDTYLNLAMHYTYSLRTGNWKQIAKYDQNIQHPNLAKLSYILSLYWIESVPQLPAKDIPFNMPANQVEGRQWVTSARRISVVWGTGTVMLLAYISPIAGLLLSLQTLAIRFTSEIYLEALPALTSLLTILFYNQWKKIEFTSFGAAARGKDRQWIFLFLSAVFLGMTAAGKYIYTLVGLVILLDYCICLIQCKANGFKYGLILISWGVVSLTSFFLFNPIIWIHTGQRLSDSILFHMNYPSTDNVLMSGRSWWYPFYLLFHSVPDYFLESRGIFPVEADALISIAGVMGLPNLWKKGRIFFLWFVISLGFLLIWPTKWDQYVMIILPPLCLSAGFCIEEIVTRLFSFFYKRKRISTS